VVQLTYVMLQMNIENTRPVEETWIAVDGQWWKFEDP
jgi:hypothetical protein